MGYSQNIRPTATGKRDCMTYKLVVAGRPIGTIETTPKKHGDKLEFDGKGYFVQYTNKKVIFARED